MTEYLPPTEDLPIFNTEVFKTGDEPLTYNEAKKRFLKYPNAQGTENLQDINVAGIATFNNDIIQKGIGKITQEDIDDNAPSNQLKSSIIRGDVYIQKPLNTSGGELRIYENSFLPTAANFTKFIQSSNDFYIRNHVGGRKIILQVSNPSAVNALTVAHTSGIPQIGINNINPTYGLDVNGTGHIVEDFTIDKDLIQNGIGRIIQNDIDDNAPANQLKSSIIKGDVYIQKPSNARGAELRLYEYTEVTGTTPFTQVFQYFNNLIIRNRAGGNIQIESNINQTGAANVIIQSETTDITKVNAFKSSSITGTLSVSDNITQTGIGRIEQTDLNDNVPPNIFKASTFYGDINIKKTSDVNGGAIRMWDIAQNNDESTQFYHAFKATVIGNLSQNGNIKMVINNGTINNNVFEISNTDLNINTTNITLNNTNPITTTQTNPAVADSSNKIPTTSWVQSAINAKIPSVPLTPKFVNYTDTQNGSTGYSNGPMINFGGNWGINDIAYFRIVSSISYNEVSGAFTNNYNISGTIHFRPYYFSAGWAPVSSAGGTLKKYVSNTGGGLVQAPYYYTPTSASGTAGGDAFFYLNAGGITSVRLSCITPGSKWHFFVSIEYIGSATGNGTVSFTNGVDTNGVNNRLQ